MFETTLDPGEALKSISSTFVQHTLFLRENTALLVGIVCAVVLTFLVFFYSLRKRAARDFITQSASFTKLLLEHIVQNALIINVQFAQDKKLPVVDFIPVKLTTSLFVLRSVRPQHALEEAVLVGDSISCTVLIQYKNIKGYYTFRGRIEKLKYTEHNLLEIAIQKPSQIDKLQRRAHLRIEPKPEYILGIALWPAHTQDGAFVNKYSLWGKPSYKTISGKIAQVRLVNISASGARLAITLMENETTPSLSKKIVFLLDLWDIDTKTKVRYLFRCVEQNRNKIPQSNIVEIGVRFTGWSNAPLINDTAHFIPVTPEGEVPPLAEWVIQRYLEENTTSSQI